MKRIEFDPAAQAELDDAMAASPRPADFRQDADVALATLAANPQVGARVGRSGVRQLILTRLPYSIVYADDPDVIRVVAFAHSSRRPGYWTPRLRRL